MPFALCLYFPKEIIHFYKDYNIGIPKINLNDYTYTIVNNQIVLTDQFINSDR